MRAFARTVQLAVVLVFAVLSAPSPAHARLIVKVRPSVVTPPAVAVLTVSGASARVCTLTIRRAGQRRALVTLQIKRRTKLRMSRGVAMGTRRLTIRCGSRTGTATLRIREKQRVNNPPETVTQSDAAPAPVAPAPPPLAPATGPIISATPAPAAEPAPTPAPTVAATPAVTPRPTPTPAPVPARVNAYNNYGAANAGRAMCRGNPGRPESMPGGVAVQNFTVPSGVATLDTALVQIDPDASVTVTAIVYVNGGERARTSALAAGDTRFNFSSTRVAPGDQVALRISFSSTSGKIITIYTAGSPGGSLTVSNGCPDGAPSFSTSSTGLRAVVSGSNL